ncbi:MAG: AmmeMemoRadiSam system protein B [Candidatus Omnitrophota bacterium]|nr:AmmeMemoRadiSam system protein B [Candidatus Omnitrophota bacterium]
MPSFAFGDSLIKQPNVSGQFYDANPQRLSASIDQLFSQADIPSIDQPINILIVPHAGYVYSGPVAAYGFKAVKKNQYKTIVILAPSHFYGFEGISIWPQGGFQTPLGVVDVDQDFAKQLIGDHEQFYFDPKAFEREHSLEVEIPFLQKTFQSFKIVPVIMGQPGFGTLEAFASTLKKIIGSRDDVLIVVSTDLSHYHEDTVARRMDKEAMEAIQQLDAPKIYKECFLREMEMCGFIPVTAAILYAKQNNLNHVELLRYANSGDVTGDRGSVVGYSAITINKDNSQSNVGNTAEAAEAAQESSLTISQKKRLLTIARQAIEKYVRNKKVLSVNETDPRLLKTEGAFVTIHQQGALRGCIGQIIADRPLFLIVREMAISAASRDPRFQPITIEELDNIDLEISVLSKPRQIKSVDEMIMGVHGVIVSRGSHHGVFLPQVAEETGWSKEEFLSQLCAQKAGLSPDAWEDPATKIEVFTAEVFSEKDVQ